MNREQHTQNKRTEILDSINQYVFTRRQPYSYIFVAVTVHGNWSTNDNDKSVHAFTYMAIRVLCDLGYEINLNLLEVSCFTLKGL